MTCLDCNDTGVHLIEGEPCMRCKKPNTTLPPHVKGVGWSSFRCACGHHLVEGNYCSSSGASWQATCPNPANPEAIPHVRYS